MIFAWAILILNITIAYWDHFDNSFHFDDSHSVESNPYIRSLSHIPQFFYDTTTFSVLPSNRSYRPIVTLSLAVDYALGSGAMFPFHLSMFLFFIAQLLLMYLLFKGILARSTAAPWDRYLAFFACSWYGLHTANAETINYISARSDSISTFFVVLALTIYAYSKSTRRYQLYLIPAALGVLTKEQAAMFVPILFLYLLYFEIPISFVRLVSRENVAKLLKITKAVIPSALVCGGLTAMGMKIAASWHPGGSSKLLYALTQPAAMVHYAVSFLYPYNLSADTDWTVVQNLADDRIYYGIAGVAALLYLAWITAKKSEFKPISFGILWFFVALIPTSSVVPLAEPINDHRMFFPFVGLTLSATVALKYFVMDYLAPVLSLQQRSAALVTTAVLILATHFVGVRHRNAVWHSEETLWYDVTLKSPKNARGLMNYGLTQMGKGNYRVAASYFEKAAAMWPDYPLVHVNLGVLRGALGEHTKAEDHFRRAIALRPSDASAHFFYASWLFGQKRIAEALSENTIAINLSTSYIEALQLMISIYQAQNDLESVKLWAKKILALDPANAVASAALREHT